MRLLRTALFAVLVAIAPGTSGEAGAAVSVEFVWTSTTGSGVAGFSSISAAPGDQLVGQIRVTPDAGGVVAYGISIEFDTDLGDELEFVAATEFLPGVMDDNLDAGLLFPTQESTGAQEGRILTFEAVSLTTGPTSGTFVAGELTFDVTANVATDGDDVFTGEFNVGFDAMGNNANDQITPVFLNAEVNLADPNIPTLSEWGLILFGTLLLGLMFLMVRRRTLSAE